jgi:hypothetical protein
MCREDVMVTCAFVRWGVIGRSVSAAASHLLASRTGHLLEQGVKEVTRDDCRKAVLDVKCVSIFCTILYGTFVIISNWARCEYTDVVE